VRRGGSGYTSLSQESGMAAAGVNRRGALPVSDSRGVPATSPCRGRRGHCACAEERLLRLRGGAAAGHYGMD
jgi:hypothetical protein